MEYQNIVTAFLFTLFAGLSTGIGGALIFFTKRTNTKYLTFSLGLSAGVMLYISFVEMFQEARHALAVYGETWGEIWVTVSFFSGILLVGIIDKLVPESNNPHEPKNFGAKAQHSTNNRLQKVGVLTMIAIAIHNFPEGIATFATAAFDPSLGIAIAVAVAIHNIPEGLAIASPIYYATGNKKKAFWYSLLSGLAEPVGALFAFIFLMPILRSNPETIGVIMAAVAGIMVYISLDELLPTAEEFGEHHLSIFGLITGMAIMAISLILL